MTTTRQTVRIGGKRTVLTTRNGKVTAKAAVPLEWELQAAATKRVKAMPEYGKAFTIAADMNAARRSPKEAAKCIATGMAAGDPDWRVYLAGGRLGLIEFKVGRATLTDSQKERHPLLASLGHPVTVLRAVTEDEAADKAEACVRGWLGEINADNDNKPIDIVSHIA